MNVWAILGFLAVLVILGLIGRRRAKGAAASLVTVDAEGIRRDAGRIHESVRWADLESIVIVTTDEGPMCDDVYWLFIGPDETGCAIPGSAVGDAVFDALSRLEGINYDAIIRAQGSAVNESFEVWKRRDPAAA